MWMWDEKLTRIQSVGLIVSFFGIVLISFASKSTNEEDIDDDPETIQGMSQQATWLIGCTCAITAAWGYAGVSIYTRKMQSLPFAVVLFYYGILATIVALTTICIESLILW